MPLHFSSRTVLIPMGLGTLVGALILICSGFMPRAYSADPGAVSTIGVDGKKYNERIDALIGTVKAAKDDVAGLERREVVKAMLELGRLRAERAVPVLVEKLAFHVSEHGVADSIRALPIHKLFPAIEALGDIGEHALPFIADAAAVSEQNEKWVRNAQLALFRIKGDVEGGNDYVRQRIKLYQSGIKRLEALIAE